MDVLLIMVRFTPLLLKKASTQDPSRIIITGSVAGIQIGSLGENATFSYSASKSAVLHLARNLAMHYGEAKQSILVNGIAPGFFPSKMASGLIEKTGGIEKLSATTPNGRLGKAEDIAAAVVYLCSRAGGHVNGHSLVLDGGKIHLGGRL